MGGADPSGAYSGKPFARPVHPDELRAVDIRLVSKNSASRNRKVRGAGRTKGRDAAGDGLGLRGDTAPGGLLMTVGGGAANQSTSPYSTVAGGGENQSTGGYASTGGGFRNSRIGEVAIGRAAVLLKADGIAIGLVPIKHHPDEAGLLGAVQLLPSWALSGHDGLLAVDIGGTNIRAGIVLTQLAKAGDLSASKVWKSDLWRHRDDSPTRDEAVARLNKMLQKLLEAAKDEKLKIAPVIGIGCPGVVEPDGTIDRGGQNLPGGNWEGSKFNLPTEIVKAIPAVGDHDTHVIMHNDAVVQGLSQVPFMTDVERWGVLTIGTGLGNARFTNIAGGNTKKDDTDKARGERDKTKGAKSDGDKVKKKKKDKDKDKEKQKEKERV